MFFELTNELYALIDKYNINILNITLVSFTVVIVIFGTLINLLESKLPTFIIQSYRYGKHSYNGRANKLVGKLEVPKSWFAHFYVFAFAWSIFALYFVLKGIIAHSEAPEYVLTFLDFTAGGAANRKVLVSSTTALIACILMTLQCARRFYETNFVQIFSRKSKMNCMHYIVGYLHYFSVILALLVNTEGFVRGSQPSFSFSKISTMQCNCILLFCFFWFHQYKSNMILVNLRKDAKSGKVATEKHILPTGGYFSFVSSPHMFFEIGMYIVLMIILKESFIWKLIMLWVFSNQVMNALLTHKWYKANFKDYPKCRKALIPFIL